LALAAASFLLPGPAAAQSVEVTETLLTTNAAQDHDPAI
jgi:hypothetical protein